MDGKIEKQPLTLTLLGTNTEYYPELKKVAKRAPYSKGAKVCDYPKGETLSLISSLITAPAAKRCAKTDIKNPYALQADEITVMNGPKTDGANVGEKIAYGLAAIVNAVSRGQVKVNLLAHSRGAIEAILIAHELENIRATIGTCTNFNEVLKSLGEQQSKRRKSAPTNNTPDIIEPLKTQINLIAQTEQESWFNRLKSNLGDLSLSLFAIDPVPGDCFPITWYDERFFVLPALIEHSEFIYYSNEHSDRGFTPVFPSLAAAEKQHFAFYSMPGHHGTGSSGNNGSQQDIIVAPPGYKTTHVQKLMLFKIIHFLSQHGVSFNDGRQLFLPHSALGKKYMEIEDEAQHINLANLDFPAILRRLYNKIQENQPGYEAYNATHYSFMGHNTQRMMLHQGHRYALFDDYFTAYTGYVNEEHALLIQTYFFKLFGLDHNKTNLIEMLNTAGTVLEKNILNLVNNEPSILQSELTQEQILKTFGVVIQLVGQQYLTHYWDANRKHEKAELYQALLAILNKFAALPTANHLSMHQFCTALSNLCFININNTLVLHAQELEKEFNCLQESIDHRLQHFFAAILTQLNHLESTSQAMLDEITNNPAYKELPNSPATTKLSYIYHQLLGKGLEQYTLEQLSKNYAEQYNHSLEEFSKLYLRLQTLIEDLATLRSMIPTAYIEIEELSLLSKIEALIATAAEHYYKVPTKELPPKAAKDSFPYLAEQHAITHFNLSNRYQESTPSLEGNNGASGSLWSKMFSFFSSSKTATSEQESNSIELETIPHQVS
ncbi:hypothetical protein ACD661_08735 [Legionella lytica]|uniref:Dot/Icm T4SS effector n=1 Tax=Legionella lytica TaxID=96232 RepID=A0ABW8D9H7_9GAMM